MKQTTESQAAAERTCGRALEAITEVGRLLHGGVSRDELRRLAEMVRRVEAATASVKCALARLLAETAGEAEAKDALRDQLGMTNHQAKQLSQVAKKLEEMPNTRAKLETGEITLQHVTSLAAAADECGAGRVDRNPGLLDEAAQTNPDHFRKQAQRWVNAHSRDRGEDLLRRQHRNRKAHAFWDETTGMGVVRAELDPIRFGLAQQALDRRAEGLRRADSGGDRPPDEVRNHRQRRADALFELLTGRSAGDLQPLPEEAGGPGRSATQLVVVADLGLLDGTRPDGECEILGTGPVPPSILKSLSPDARLCGIIFGGKGRTLWLGRNRRLGNDAQRLAAAVRDRGCVRCEIPVHLNDLHHLLDWRDGGPTDIDNLASLCGAHHRELEEHHLKLEKIGKTWHTRPRTGPPARAGPAR